MTQWALWSPRHFETERGAHLAELALALGDLLQLPLSDLLDLLHREPEAARLADETKHGDFALSIEAVACVRPLGLGNEAQ